MAEVALRLEHLRKVFGRTVGVDDLSLDVMEGEVFTLLGPSGCGKTTTLRLIAGLEDPDAGRIVLRDRVIVSVADGKLVPTHRRSMGMVFQSYAIWPHMTVFENVAYPLQLRRVRRGEIKQRVERVLDIVGLAGLESRQGPQLSGGQQQRVALARALVYEPSVLLLDEPFSNLDAKLREQMRVQLKLLLARVNITAILVTHDQVEALSLSNRVALMNHGRVEQIGTPREMYERPVSSFARDFLGRTVLMNGHIGDDSDGWLNLRLDDMPGLELRVSASTSPGVHPGQSVVAAIRPEDVVIADDGRVHGNELVGTVEAMLFVGDHCECTVRVGDQARVLLAVPRSASIEEGQSIRLGVAPERIQLWPV